jgi:glycosyltransferase involved in cell wall biosynthesis
MRHNLNLTRHWVAIPNFVDCEVFRPVGCADERLAIRRRLGIPDGAFVVGCVAAVKKDHKRVDYLIGEVSGFRVQGSGHGDDLTPKCQVTGLFPINPQPSTLNHCPPPFLLIAGARTGESPELQEMAERLLPGRHCLLLDCPREQMPDVYRAMDVFVLPSLFEMMPIALLEAMASGLPCLVNRHPVLEWMVGEETADRRLQTEAHRPKTEDRRPQTIDKEGKEGARVGGGRWTGEENPGLETDFCISINPQPSTIPHPPSTIPHSPPAAGLAIDMSRDGELAAALATLTPEWIARHGSAARQRAERLFEKNVVIGQYVEYYRHVTGEK